MEKSVALSIKKNFLTNFVLYKFGNKNLITGGTPHHPHQYFYICINTSFGYLYIYKYT